MSDEEQGIFHGPLHSDVAGRTDHLKVHTRNGAYILPADVVSHIGENNTTSGLKILKRVFSGIPYSGSKSPYGQSLSAPYGDEIQNRASGGKASGLIPVVLAGGEYAIHPDVVKAIGDGDIHTGHEVLDKFVLHIRKELIKTLKKLPGPKK